MWFLLDECVFVNVQFQAGDVGPRIGPEVEVPIKGRGQPLAFLSVTLQIRRAAGQLV